MQHGGGRCDVTSSPLENKSLTLQTPQAPLITQATVVKNLSILVGKAEKTGGKRERKTCSDVEPYGSAYFRTIKSSTEDRIIQRCLYLAGRGTRGNENGEAMNFVLQYKPWSFQKYKCTDRTLCTDYCPDIFFI